MSKKAPLQDRVASLAVCAPRRRRVSLISTFQDGGGCLRGHVCREMETQSVVHGAQMLDVLKKGYSEARKAVACCEQGRKVVAVVVLNRLSSVPICVWM